MELTDNLKLISGMINSYFAGGLIPDKDTLDFLKSGYGFFETDEIASFLEAGDDSGAVIEMISYPMDSFREAIEELIPSGGFDDGDIKNIEDLLNSENGKIFINLSERKIFLTEKDSALCRKRFIQRLNLNLTIDYISGTGTSAIEFNIFSARAYLRKKRFSSSAGNCLFLDDLICSYQTVRNGSEEEFRSLFIIAADILNGSDRKALDILYGKKYFYENAISESEEFARLLKTYSMEFIMLKRIQPPLISVDESRSMIHIIDRLTSIVYGMIIPSAQNIILDS
jgi:hypothetical protein